MVYDYDVRQDGIYYKAGEEVPQLVAMPVSEDGVENETPSEGKEKKTRKSAKQ